MKVRIRSVLVLLLAATFVAACGQGDSDPADLAASGAESTTRAPRFTDQSDRPLVTYDPCLDIPESAIEEAGLDPLSKSEQDFPGGDRTFLGCTYITRRVVGVNILSTNSTLDARRVHRQGSRHRPGSGAHSGRPSSRPPPECQQFACVRAQCRDRVRLHRCHQKHPRLPSAPRPVVRRDRGHDAHRPALPARRGVARIDGASIPAC